MEYLNTAQELLDFIMRCKSPFHVVKEAGDLLNENGYTKLCLVVRASINDDALVPTDDDLIDAKYVSKEEFMRTDFQYNELAAQDYADTIWSEDVLKPSAHR